MFSKKLPTTDELVKRIRRLAVGFIALTVAVAIGGYVVVNVITSRDARRSDVNKKFNNLACIALRYTPPTSDFNMDLRKQYPDCPHYVTPRTVAPKVGKSKSESPQKPPKNALGAPGQSVRASVPKPSSGPTSPVAPHSGTDPPLQVTKTGHSPDLVSLVLCPAVFLEQRLLSFL